MRNILLTGATGFVGRGILDRLLQQSAITVYVPTRRPQSVAPNERVIPIAADLSLDRIASEVLRSTNAIIHAAATVHLLDEYHPEQLERIYKSDITAAMTLAEDAAAAGVRRFVFISSIKVNGENTEGRGPFTEADLPAPNDPYGQSKARIEQSLAELSIRSGMEVVVIRPPLVYGPGVGANFANLMRLARSGLPLPLGNIPNRRSLLARTNLADFVACCLDHPAAANQVFLISDGHDISTTELVHAIATASGRRALLFPMPLPVLRAVSHMAGRSGALEKLVGSLQVNSIKARTLLNWTPPDELATALKQTVKGLEA